MRSFELKYRVGFLGAHREEIRIVRSCRVPACRRFRFRPSTVWAHGLATTGTRGLATTSRGLAAASTRCLAATGTYGLAATVAGICSQPSPDGGFADAGDSRLSRSHRKVPADPAGGY